MEIHHSGGPVRGPGSTAREGIIVDCATMDFGVYI